MDDKLFQSVIKITRQRDADALDQGLLTALADYVPLNEIAIIKMIKETITDKVKEILRLAISTDTPDNKNYTLDNDEKVIIANSQTIECIETASVIKEGLDGLVYLYIPLLIDNKVTGVLKIESYEDISKWLPSIEGIVQVYCNYLEIFNESERDKLTGLLNRKTFDYKLGKLLEKQRKQQEKYVATNQYAENRHALARTHAWLAMLDIDHFKRINDTFGHLFGDEVILLISQIMKQFFRSSDLLFRFGGEEFIVILEPIPDEMAKKTFECFRKKIAEHHFPQIGTITVSLGFAGITKNDHSHVILERADKALYYAKEHGRNCVYSFQELLESGKADEKGKAGATIFFDEK